MPDGSTPFIVYVRREGKKTKQASTESQPEQNLTVVRTPTQYKVYLSSETGYMTVSIFQCIMKQFIKWWTESHPGLECYLVCDNLCIHKQKSVKEITEPEGIHIRTIMPGSSHWFQVHDQKPFGTLKKKMTEKKNRFSMVSSLRPKESKDFLLGVYSIVESHAFAPHVLTASFAEVGLWPWNPEKIRNLCQEHCPAPSQLRGSRELRKFERIMKVLTAEQEAERDSIISIGRCERLSLSEESVLYQLHERKILGSDEADDESRSSVSGRKTTSRKMQPPSKRSRRREDIH